MGVEQRRVLASVCHDGNVAKSTSHGGPQVLQKKYSTGRGYITELEAVDELAEGVGGVVGVLLVHRTHARSSLRKRSKTSPHGGMKSWYETKINRNNKLTGSWHEKCQIKFECTQDTTLKNIS